jgi:uncharacterized repeat protein (TIGR03803 family)
MKPNLLRMLPLALLAIAFTLVAQAQDTETVLYTFDGTHGSIPFALIQDVSGNLYGTTGYGGNLSCSIGCGIVFKLSNVNGRWVQTVIHSFTGGTDGSTPVAIVMDAHGNIFGSAQSGGSGGSGVVFQLTPIPIGGWGFKVLHSFPSSSSDGRFPNGLTTDGSGNVYGATGSGGSKGCGGFGCGTIFKLSPTKAGPWKQTVLHRFAGPPSDGNDPYAVAFDSSGNLDGVTGAGGADCTNYLNPGCGTVFQLSPSTNGWKEKVLHTFNGSDGFFPNNFLIDAAGNLFGVTNQGGNLSDCGGYGCGVVFRISRDSGVWTETTIHEMNSVTDGEFVPTIAIDKSGNLYATAELLGPFNNGTVFELSPQSDGTWNETVLFDFPTSTDGQGPVSILVDPSGNVFGAAFSGGDKTNGGDGLIFQLTP